MLSCLNAPTANNCPFASVFSALIFAFLLVILLFNKMAPEHSAKDLSSAPKCKKAYDVP